MKSDDIAGRIMAIAKRRGIYWPSFDIYGGLAGFYDYGPLGVLLRENIYSRWRALYRMEGFYEIDTPNINPEEVFVASGHASSFSDVLVSCMSCGESFRADHLTDSSSIEEAKRKIASGKVRCPRCGGTSFSEPREFNLMFRTFIGPQETKRGYLRPETAQGVFINFQSLLRFFRDTLPFGVIQRGKGFRNEISPRQGFIRLREFNMMEAELFVDSEEKHWPNFDAAADEEARLIPAGREPVSVTFGEAVSQGIIGSEVVAYFMFLTQRFMQEIGISRDRSRFRQHAPNELAHYASEAWDFEAELSSGWTELTGIADRGTYDLNAHASHSGADLSYFKKYREERKAVRKVIMPNRSELGKEFGADAPKIADALSAADPSKARDALDVNVEGKVYSIGRRFYTVKEEEIRETGYRMVPRVIEPASGLDRIFYAVLEHSFDTETESFAFLPSVAPVKAGVFPLMDDEAMVNAARSIHSSFLSRSIEAYYDATGSIGRRYARMDEIGTPYCITVDELTLSDGTVTVRERKTRKQIRVKREAVVEIISGLLSGMPFEEVPYNK